MPKYLLLAEKISKNIKKEHTNNHLKNLNNLIMEIKKAINGTEWLCCTKLFLRASSAI